MLFRNVYIGLGSNLGDRKAALSGAIDALEAELVEVKAVKSITSSPIYETDAWGMADGTPAFLNQVVCLETNLELSQVLELLMGVEAKFGREREENALAGVYNSRTLDLDILVAGKEVVNNNTLKVPHPRISMRRFVLQPLADLEPTLHIPGTKGTVSDLLESCPELPEVKKL